MTAPETIFQRDGLAALARRLAELGTRRVLVIAQPSRRHVDEVMFALEQFKPIVEWADPESKARVDNKVIELSPDLVDGALERKQVRRVERIAQVLFQLFSG